MFTFFIISLMTVNLFSNKKCFSCSSFKFYLTIITLVMMS